MESLVVRRASGWLHRMVRCGRGCRTEVAQRSLRGERVAALRAIEPQLSPEREAKLAARCVTGTGSGADAIEPRCASADSWTIRDIPGAHVKEGSHRQRKDEPKYPNRRYRSAEFHNT